MTTLERSVWDAQASPERHASSDPQQLDFELEAALLSANWYHHLNQDPAYIQRLAVQSRTG
jgi:hypothetical protein